MKTQTVKPMDAKRAERGRRRPAVQPGPGPAPEHGDAYLPPDSQAPEKTRFTFIDSKEFLTADYKQRFLIPRVLVADQPAVVAGPSKAMKTSIIVDMAVSLASATPFLGKFPIPTPARIAVVSGESGAATLQETALRIIRARGLDEEAVKNLHHRLQWCFELPQFPDPADMSIFAEKLLALNVAAVVIDPVYLCLGGDIDHANLFQMGAAFRVVAETLLKRQVTPILVHHANRQLRVGEPMEIQHLAYSGLEQFARQFVMMNRSAAYRGDGVHELWVSAGGSAGHGGLWSVRIEEGLVNDDFTGRYWNVDVLSPTEAADKKSERKASAKEEADRKRAHRDETDFLNALDRAMGSHKHATQRFVRGLYPRLKGNAFHDTVSRLVDRGEIENYTHEATGGHGAIQRIAAYRRRSPV